MTRLLSASEWLIRLRSAPSTKLTRLLSASETHAALRLRLLLDVFFKSLYVLQKIIALSICSNSFFCISLWLGEYLAGQIPAQSAGNLATALYNK